MSSKQFFKRQVEICPKRSSKNVCGSANQGVSTPRTPGTGSYIWFTFAALALAVLMVSPASAEKPQSRGLFGCGQGMTCPPPQWTELEADNGRIYYVDVATIRPFDSIKRNIFGFHGVEALIYTDDGRPVSHLNAGWYMFDCDKPYMVGKSGFAPRPEYLPSRSVGYQLRKIACGGP